MFCDLQLSPFQTSLTQLFQLKVLKSEIDRQREREVSLPMSEGLLKDSSETGMPRPMNNLSELLLIFTNSMQMSSSQ